MYCTRDAAACWIRIYICCSSAFLLIIPKCARLANQNGAAVHYAALFVSSDSRVFFLVSHTPRVIKSTRSYYFFCFLFSFFIYGVVHACERLNFVYLASIQTHTYRRTYTNHKRKRDKSESERKPRNLNRYDVSPLLIMITLMALHPTNSSVSSFPFEQLKA